MVNLANPGNHFQVSQTSLGAGKRVYAEKSLAMTLPEARALYDLAQSKSLYLASAPCSLLGETAQTIWKALREEKRGTVRLVDIVNVQIKSALFPQTQSAAMPPGHTLRVMEQIDVIRGLWRRA